MIRLKKRFKLQSRTKSQVKDRHAWYWDFTSVYSHRVHIRVTTFTPTEEPNEQAAWDELNKAVSYHPIASVLAWLRLKKVQHIRRRMDRNEQARD